MDKLEVEQLAEIKKIAAIFEEQLGLCCFLDVSGTEALGWESCRSHVARIHGLTNVY